MCGTFGTKESYDTDQRVKMLIDHGNHSSIESHITGPQPFQIQPTIQRQIQLSSTQKKPRDEKLAVLTDQVQHCKMVSLPGTNMASRIGKSHEKKMAQSRNSACSTISVQPANSFQRRESTSDLQLKLKSNRPGALETAAPMSKTQRLQAGLATAANSKTHQVQTPLVPKSSYQLKCTKQMSEHSSHSDNSSNDCSNYSQDDAEEEISFDGNEEEKDEELRNKFQSSPDSKTNVEAAAAGSPIDPISRAAQKVLEEKKEVTYSAYGINLENTCKLLSCSKVVSMVGKSDLKAKRMFVTSVASLQEQRPIFGYGKLGKKTIALLDEKHIFNRQVRRANYLDRQSRGIILRKQKIELFQKLLDLQRKYLSYEEFQKIAPSQPVFYNCPDGPPSKNTKAYRRALSFFKHSMINIENLSIMDPQLDEHHETVQHYIDMREQRLVNAAQARIFVEPVAQFNNTAENWNNRRMPLYLQKKSLMQKLQTNSIGGVINYVTGQDDPRFFPGANSTYKPMICSSRLIGTSQVGYKTTNHFALGQQHPQMIAPPGSTLINVIKISHGTGLDQLNATQQMLQEALKEEESRRLAECALLKQQVPARPKIMSLNGELNMQALAVQMQTEQSNNNSVLSNKSQSAGLPQAAQTQDPSRPAGSAMSRFQLQMAQQMKAEQSQQMLLMVGDTSPSTEQVHHYALQPRPALKKVQARPMGRGQTSQGNLQSAPNGNGSQCSNYQQSRSHIGVGGIQGSALKEKSSKKNPLEVVGAPVSQIDLGVALEQSLKYGPAGYPAAPQGSTRLEPPALSGFALPCLNQATEIHSLSGGGSPMNLKQLSLKSEDDLNRLLSTYSSGVAAYKMPHTREEILNRLDQLSASAKDPKFSNQLDQLIISNNTLAQGTYPPPQQQPQLSIDGISQAKRVQQMVQQSSTEGNNGEMMLRIYKQNISRPETISNTPQHHVFDFSNVDTIDHAQLNRTEKFKGNSFKQFQSTIKSPQDQDKSITIQHNKESSFFQYAAVNGGTPDPKLAVKGQNRQGYYAQRNNSRLHEILDTGTDVESGTMHISSAPSAKNNSVASGHSIDVMCVGKRVANQNSQGSQNDSNGDPNIKSKSVRLKQAQKQPSHMKLSSTFHGTSGQLNSFLDTSEYHSGSQATTQQVNNLNQGSSVQRGHRLRQSASYVPQQTTNQSQHTLQTLSQERSIQRLYKQERAGRGKEHLESQISQQEMVAVSGPGSKMNAGKRQTYRLERVDSAYNRKNIFLDNGRQMGIQVGAAHELKQHQAKVLFESGSRRRSNYTMINKDSSTPHHQLIKAGGTSECPNRSMIQGHRQKQQHPLDVHYPKNLPRSTQPGFTCRHHDQQENHRQHQQSKSVNHKQIVLETSENQGAQTVWPRRAPDFVKSNVFMNGGPVLDCKGRGYTHV